MLIGMGYPAIAGDKGLFKTSTNEDLIKGNIIQILGTRRGERVMLPLFGTRIWEYIHEPLDAPTVQFLRAEIADAIRIWEPRAIFVSASFSQNTTEGTLTIKLVYRTELSPEEQTVDLTYNRAGGVTM